MDRHIMSKLRSNAKLDIKTESGRNDSACHVSEPDNSHIKGPERLFFVLFRQLAGKFVA